MDYEPTVTLPTGKPVLRCLWDTVTEWQTSGRRVTVEGDQVVVTPIDHVRFEDLLECMSRRSDEIEAILECDRVPNA